MTLPPAFSVIIPVFRDWDRLTLCLAALEGQSVPREQFEIIAVDNDREPLSEHLRPVGVAYVHEPNGYSYTARNAGMKRAVGEIIAFTDADCIPDPHWLERGRISLTEADGCDLVGGRVEMFADKENVATRYELAFYLRQDKYFKQFGGFATANLLVRRRVCDRIGGFDASLESCGDFEFCRRAAESGFRLRYAPDALVRHPARANLGDLLKKNSRIARGFVRFGYERRTTLKSKLRWFYLLTRPALRDWYYTLSGGRGSEVLGRSKRPAVLALQILLRYHFVWAHCRGILRSRREAGRRGRRSSAEVESAHQAKG